MTTFYRGFSKKITVSAVRKLTLYYYHFYGDFCTPNTWVDQIPVGFCPTIFPRGVCTYCWLQCFLQVKNRTEGAVAVEIFNLTIFDNLNSKLDVSFGTKLMNPAPTCSINRRTGLNLHIYCLKWFLVARQQHNLTLKSIRVKANTPPPFIYPETAYIIKLNFCHTLCLHN